MGNWLYETKVLQEEACFSFPTIWQCKHVVLFKSSSLGHHLKIQIWGDNSYQKGLILAIPEQINNSFQVFLSQLVSSDESN